MLVDLFRNTYNDDTDEKQLRNECERAKRAESFVYLHRKYTIFSIFRYNDVLVLFNLYGRNYKMYLQNSKKCGAQHYSRSGFCLKYELTSKNKNKKTKQKISLLFPPFSFFSFSFSLFFCCLSLVRGGGGGSLPPCQFSVLLCWRFFSIFFFFFFFFYPW